ncbi:ribonucleoprotein PTB-binding 2 [Ascaphus truei]|uniref:ribonucleoprotein PTB-binding 2 n=1 Tax=Ascaphus truei TaxID=8439 RepID=UPI003F590A06
MAAAEAARDTGLLLSSLGQRGGGGDLWQGRGAGEPGSRGVVGAEEAARRLEVTRRELGNRRKILIRGLPQDCSSQDIHDLLKDYEIKYCYVDKNKKTAFITLLNGEQAQNAIQNFHQYTLREKEISVQLQPTDALLCVSNLPPLFTLQEFEELVRAHGNIERCLLVYSELTGHSKGYGFVEYMKKDSASKARLQLIGKPIEEFMLFAQWMDINQLTEDLIHSKCLCVDKLPKDYSDSDGLMELFSTVHKPLFCQLSQEEGSCFGGFAVIEYESAEQAEEIRDIMDGTTVQGSRIQVSFCAPGSPGRSTLAALVAAQGMYNRKGLLPEPNQVQIMQSLNNPAMLQMLLHPQQRGRGGKHGASSGRPHFVNPTVSQALLQLNNLHQKPALGSSCNVLLQNFSHLQMAQQQLLQLKSTQSNNCKPGLLGEAPASMLQSAMGTAQPASDQSQREVHKSMMPFFHNQHMVGAAMSRLSQEQQSASMALSEGSGSQTYHQQAAAMLTGQSHPQSQLHNADISHGNMPNTQTSLLGEPPRDIRLSTNPYLNLASVMPGTSLTGMGTRSLQMQHAAMDGSASQECSSQPGLESYFNYSQQYGDYSQEAAQQWYDHYAAYSNAQADVRDLQSEDGQKQQVSESYQPGIGGEDYYYQTSSTSGYGDYNTYVQAPPTYYSTAQGSYQMGSTQSVDKTPTSEKRAYFASAAETSPAGYVNQYSQGSGEHYSDSYFKRKKVY